MPIIDPICLIDDDSHAIFHDKGAAGIGPVAQLPEIVMSVRSAILAATLTLTSVGAVRADALKPIHSAAVANARRLKR